MTDGHTDRGKWSQPGVPHKGWTCTGIEDLEDDLDVCGMCESAEVRYLHIMEHADYPGPLGVGCICAEHMEQDYVGPRLREKKLRSRARRRATWAKREWSISARGNQYLNTGGYNITVFKAPEFSDLSWRIRIEHRESGRRQLGKRAYGSVDEAKRAAFDALMWAHEHL